MHILSEVTKIKARDTCILFKVLHVTPVIKVAASGEWKWNGEEDFDVSLKVLCTHVPNPEPPSHRAKPMQYCKVNNNNNK